MQRNIIENWCKQIVEFLLYNSDDPEDVIFLDGNAGVCRGIIINTTCTHHIVFSSNNTNTSYVVLEDAKRLLLYPDF